MKLEASHISIPQPDGAHIRIPTKNASFASELLGILYAPRGNGVPHMEMMGNKELVWADRL